MSVQTILAPGPHKWANVDINDLRVRGDLTLDGDLIIDSLSANQMVATGASKELKSSIGANDSVLTTSHTGAPAWVGNFSSTASNLALGVGAGSAATLAGTNVNNVLLGPSAGAALTTGQDNVCVGNQSGPVISSGNGNTTVGRGAGSVITTENSNTCVGFAANITAGNTNSTALGVGAVATASNQFMLGNGSIATVEKDAVATATLGAAANPWSGIYLQTSGGTASNLNYYEELSSSTSTVTSSIWAASKACTWKLTRIGRTVFLNLSDVSAQADLAVAGKILHDEAIPVRFRPVGVYPVQLIAINNNTAIGSETTGDCEVSIALGIIAIGATSGGGNFTGGAPGADVSGFRQFSMSWQI